MKRRIRFGVQTAPQYTSWRELKEAWKVIDACGYDSAWVFDHFYPIFSDPGGPCLEGWVSLAALAAETSSVQIGVLVTGNTYRHPAVLAKMGATLDHISNGRLILGLGAAWFESEHTAYGIPFYTVGERIARLDEAAGMIKMLWTQTRSDFEGRFYRLQGALCEPKPLQKPHPPIMIGGGGEKKTLRVAAKHADQWNTFGSPDVFRHKISILKEHCAAVGRNADEIEITWAGTCAVTSSASAKDKALRSVAEWYHATPETVEPALLVGTENEVRDRIGRFIEVGVTHFILSMRSPFDLTAIRRFADQIIPGVRS
jgi:F420-dependent oxidoreductase-like protein